jgi:hypothetical protein
MTLHPCRFCVSGAVVAVAVRQIVSSRLTFRQNVQRELSSWDSNLGRRNCENCEPFLEAAEIALVAAECGHPAGALVFRDLVSG